MRKISWGRMMLDFLAAAGALGAAFWIRFHLVPHLLLVPEPPEVERYVTAAPIVALALVVVFGVMGVYRAQRGVQFVDEFFSVVGAMAVTGLVVFAVIALIRFEEPGGQIFSYSRATFVIWLLTATFLITVARYGVRRWERARRIHGLGVDRTVVVGHGASADLLIQRMRMFPDYGYRVLGVVADGLDQGHDFSGVKVLGPTADLHRIVLNRGVEMVFVALPEESQDRVLDLVDSCRDLDAEFRIVPSMLEIMTTRVTADQLDGIPLLQLKRGLDIDEPKVVLKRALDVVFAVLSLLLTAPILMALAILVRITSEGPIMIHQERVGLRGRRFLMHKFRTMRADAESDSGPVWAVPGDPRVTDLGRLLRRTSLDELPQFWNILRGDMSLVGPRPERPVFVREFSAKMRRYPDRHRIRPGLTGWAQVNDLRGQTPVEERLIYDLYYIENWSLAFDLKIALIQLFRIFTHKNAY